MTEYDCVAKNDERKKLKITPFLFFLQVKSQYETTGAPGTYTVGKIVNNFAYKRQYSEERVRSQGGKRLSQV
jgi:hypothetical protein